MPGRIEGYEPLLAAAPVLPLWRRSIMRKLKLDKPKAETKVSAPPR